MKGLLLKDWYMAQKYCRSHLLIAVLFLIVAFIEESNMFFMTYPCIFVATIPTVLLSYDERCKWDEYCGTLPCTKKQIVSEKFIVGLIATIPLIIITTVVFGIKSKMAGYFDLDETMEIASVLIIVTAIMTAVTLPFMIKFGVERGRIAYYVMIGFATALAILAPNVIGADMQKKMNIPFAPIAIVFAAVIYTVSWYISVKFYEKREV